MAVLENRCRNMCSQFPKEYNRRPGVEVLLILTTCTSIHARNVYNLLPIINQKSSGDVQIIFKNLQKGVWPVLRFGRMLDERRMKMNDVGSGWTFFELVVPAPHLFSVYLNTGVKLLKDIISPTS